MRIPRLTWPRVALLTVLTALFAAGYVGGQSLDVQQLWAQSEPGDDGDDRMIPPGPDVTPEPGVTPDKTEPYWYVPYENAERMRPKVRGEINGITVGVSSGPVPDCEVGRTLHGEEALEAVRGTYFEIDLPQLPSGLTLIPEAVVLGRCVDGTPTWVSIELDRRAIDPDGGNITITRMREITWWRDEGSVDRWSTGVITGRQAAFLDQIAGVFGRSSIIVLGPELDGSTRIRAANAPLDLLNDVAEAIYR